MVGIPIAITSSAVGLKICVIPEATKKYKSIIEKWKRSMIKQYCYRNQIYIAFLTYIEFLTSKALIDSVISHDEFVLINNVLKEYNEMKEGITIKRLNQFIEDFGLFIKQCYHTIAWSAEKTQKVKSKSCKDKRRKNDIVIKLSNMW